jgi:hypothetical protein
MPAAPSGCRSLHATISGTSAIHASQPTSGPGSEQINNIAAIKVKLTLTNISREMSARRCHERQTTRSGAAETLASEDMIILSCSKTVSGTYFSCCAGTRPL